MARQGRVYFEKAVYHVCLRGNNKQAILKGDENKSRFLESLASFKLRFNFKLYGFVLMDNHVHIVLETNNLVKISKIMQAIALSYSMKYRNKYDYTGYVWQGRFKSSVIIDERYILACLEYIHNNPIRAGVVNKIEDYPWSSYGFYNHQDHLSTFIQIDDFNR